MHLAQKGGGGGSGYSGGGGWAGLQKQIHSLTASRTAVSMTILLGAVAKRELRNLMDMAKVGDPYSAINYMVQGMKRLAPVVLRPYLFRFSAFLANAEAPVPQAAVATAENIIWHAWCEVHSLVVLGLCCPLCVTL